ncbi:MAG: Wzz/FepE/Etk N-terminal domain-containing protein, partial [Chloroflexota bacterium]
MEDGFTLRDYAAALISKWWVVLLILVAATATAIIISSQRPPQYQVRTQLLLVPRTSAGLTNPGPTLPNVGNALSVGTLSNLAMANDLLEDIIVTLRLDNPASGSLATVEALTEMMTVDIQVSEKDKTAVLPLLTL